MSEKTYSDWLRTGMQEAGAIADKDDLLRGHREYKLNPLLDSAEEDLNDATDRITELEAEVAVLKAEILGLRTMISTDSTRIARLTEQRDRVRDALAWLAASNWLLGYYSDMIVLVLSSSAALGPVFKHDGTAADIERALLEAVDAARKATT